MEKIGLFVVAAVGGFAAVASFGAGSGADGTAGLDSHMRGCMRQMEQVLPDDAKATKACECMYGEFEKKGLSLLDAFGSDFDEMSRITRSCAAKQGALID